MTEELIEAVARALLLDEYACEPDDVPNLYSIAKWRAQVAITAYEAARGDGIAEALAETKRLEENAKDAFARGYVDAQGAMIAASQGER